MNAGKSQEWHAISVKLPKEGSDWISHLLFELGSVGNLEDECLDPAAVAMKGYFPTEIGTSASIIQSINRLLEEKGIRPLSTYAATIKLQNWAEQAAQMFAPIKITENLTIINPWAEYDAKVGEVVIVINPGMAFGTGLHATTQLAARLIIEAVESGPVGSMCDVGSGSAILSIIAARHGVKSIDGIEIDEDARTSSIANIKRNNCKNVIKILPKIEDADKRYDIVAANILFATIIESKNMLVERVAHGGKLILSGITKEEDEKFLKMFTDKNISFIKKEEQDGWMGYLFEAKGERSRVKG